MKGWLAKLPLGKGGVWALVAVCCLAAYLVSFLPGAPQSGMTEEESRISRTLSAIAGAGETRVTIYYAQEASAFGSGGKAPVGAVVVAAGAGEIDVRLNLLRAAETLLGLPPERVDVFPMEDSR